MLNNTPENLSPARVLSSAYFFIAQTILKEDNVDLTAITLVHNPTTDKTEQIFVGDPDEFIAEIEDAMEKGLRPLAIEIWNDAENEDQEFSEKSTFVDLEYLCEITLEDQAIVEGNYVCQFEEMIN